MRAMGVWMAAGAAMLAARATAQAVVASGPAQGMAVVPPDERLTVAGVLANASAEVQVMFAILLISVVAALATWAISLRKVGLADARGLATALGRLRIVRSAATPLGVLTGTYTLFCGFLGIANVRPAPTVTIMAPGWAEAALAVMLGLLASTVAVVCERHLEARVRRAAA